MSFRSRLKLGFLLLSFLVWADVGAYGFDPRSYDSQAGKMVTCEAVKRTGVAEAKNPFTIEHEEHVPIQLRTFPSSLLSKEGG